MRRYSIAALCVLAAITVSLQSHAHRGGLDAIGGHNTAQTYHFHKGVLKGKAFADKGKAIEALNKSESKPAITLASFNVRIYSNRSRDDVELRQIVEQLSPFDIIAIQEVRDSIVLDRTIVMLNALSGVKWDYLISEKVGRGVKERYAFMFRTDRVQAISEGRVADDPSDVFIREPYIASFRAGNFDFTLITIHMLYKSKNASERGDEFAALGQVYLDVQAADPNEQDVIVLGDFNDPPSNDAGDKSNKRFQRMIDVVPDLECQFKGAIRTTITDTSLYDNICFQPQHTVEYAKKKGIVKFDETVFGNDDKAALLAVSDHRPIWAIFNNNVDDD
ncbi:MAG: endonuclease/exonuclease/phosphatase family protein [Sulfuriflexus sp.]|nr:endonuclease/exonuclease/phosphatase family protein [Sulfuriflexus sp.]